jgi:autotransporter passenger strand-loop-strand repeat protein
VTALDANIQIDAGASATGTVVSSGTSVRVYGSAADGVFTSAAAEFVYAGGVASGDSIQSGAKAIISSGGRAVGTTVSSGGIAYVFASGTAAGTVLSKGGKALVSSGGVTTATMVSSGGLAYVFAGGVASGDIVQDDGKELISSGGVASGATVQGGGAEYIYSSGGASGTLLSGGDAFVSSGGSLVSATTSAGGADYLRASGTATHTVVSAGGYELISSGGIASGTELLSGGKQYIYSSGTAVDATVSSGAREVISDGGVVSGLSLLSGGDLVDTGEVVISGAGTLAGRLSGLGAVIETGGGDLVLSDSGATFGGEAVVSGGTVELATAGALGNGDVTFVEPLTGSAVLQIDAADAPTAGGTFANTLFDFSGAHEDVVLTSIAYVTGATAAIVGSTLVLTDGANTYTFNVAGTTAVSYPVLDDNGVVEIDPRAISPKVIAFAHAAAAFAPSDAANTALVSSTSPTAHTPFLHATASAGAGHP